MGPSCEYAVDVPQGRIEGGFVIKGMWSPHFGPGTPLIGTDMLPALAAPNEPGFPRLAGHL
jgi:hypothetical protein